MKPKIQANQQFSLKKVLAPFNIALALSIGRIHSFEEQVIIQNVSLAVKLKLP